MKSVLIVIAFSISIGHAFTLKTTSFDINKPMPQKYIYNRFGCAGENLSPALSWEEVPKDTKSFAITVFDPDAPTGSGWWHWTVVNIPVNVTSLPEGASPESKLPRGVVEARNDYGTTGYGGACPPIGSKPHKYIFTIYALKTEKLDLSEQSSGALVGFHINQNILGKASFTATFGR